MFLLLFLLNPAHYDFALSVSTLAPVLPNFLIPNSTITVLRFSLTKLSSQIEFSKTLKETFFYKISRTPHKSWDFAVIREHALRWETPSTFTPRVIFFLRPYLVVAHVGFRTIEKTFKLQSIGIAIRYDIAHLTHNCCKYKHSNEIAHDGENIPLVMDGKSNN